MTKTKSNEEIINAIKQRNELEIAATYDLYRKEFLGFFVGTMYSKHSDAEDLYQDAWIELCWKIEQGKITTASLTSSLKTYLYGIAKFKFMANNRKNGHLKTIEIMPEIEPISISEENINLEMEQIIETEVNAMGEPCCSLLDKYYWEDKSCAQIALEKQYKNSDTVKTQKYKCMQKLKCVISEKIKHIIAEDE